MLDATRRLEGFCRATLGLDGPVPLHAPRFAGREWDYVKDCLDTGWVSSVGAYVDRFEAMVAEAAGTRFAVATVNGTAALHAALHALGVGPGDAVVCPTLTFVATCNAVAYTGATPLLVDIDPATLAIDPARLRALLAGWSGAPVKAVVPVHIFGHPADMDALNAVAAEFGIPVIEDSTEALGSRYRGRRCGSLGLMGTFSFNGNKILTAGGGGMVTTDDESLARRLKHLTTTARAPHAWAFDHDEVGFNYRLPNLNAALGCAQMERLGEFAAAKRRLAALYADLFADCPGCRLFRPPAFADGIHWLNAVLFDDPADRDRFLAETNAAGLQTRPCWTLMHLTGAHGAAPRMAGLSAAEAVAARLVNIPSSPWMVPE
ncbi:LegC family aminotransferase [Magnetospirillum sp. UT-4]|uniref:LegC family aminotransferase n=1 Tax=Magnetospirillum sp. UT-4 TaxID=2681467 RepID=UPI00137E8231|nr:LegC family aminotransferase [Magnetospirillum sp. UT-4]CAA7621691.1 Aminotransferase, LLPSF_NHT_00031 family [Magnetospirillum sp. UT-4]